MEDNIEIKFILPDKNKNPPDKNEISSIIK